MKRVVLCCCLVFVLAFGFTPQILSFIGFPSNIKIIQGIEQSLKINFPFEVYITCDNPENLLINGKPMAENVLKINLADPIQLQADTIGKVGVDFKLFGLIPIRHMEVDVVPEVRVYPSGHSIGVLLHSDGILVVDDSFVEGEDGHRYFPAKDAGIRKGDYILEMDDRKVESKQDVATAINVAGTKGRDIKVKVRRPNGNINIVSVKPVKATGGGFMIGLFIEDGVAGVGTMTFYEPKSGFYGALGHVITEAHTNAPIQIRSGEIVNANISGINSGQRGVPGEKLGTFSDYDDVLGVVRKNCDFGLYGKLNTIPKNSFFEEPIPVATSRQIERGPASIYTVVEGGKIEKFAIEIEQVYYQNRPATKGLVIRIVDPRLLRITGGIVQGMSGSPIIQNNRLVGAVTHVFVNDPKKGYGILAEWMVKEAGISLTGTKRELVS